MLSTLTTLAQHDDFRSSYCGTRNWHGAAAAARSRTKLHHWHEAMRATRSYASHDAGTRRRLPRTVLVKHCHGNDAMRGARKRAKHDTGTARVLPRGVA